MQSIIGSISTMSEVQVQTFKTAQIRSWLKSQVSWRKAFQVWRTSCQISRLSHSTSTWVEWKMTFSSIMPVYSCTNSAPPQTRQRNKHSPSSRPSRSSRRVRHLCSSDLPLPLSLLRCTSWLASQPLLPFSKCRLKLTRPMVIVMIAKLSRNSKHSTTSRCKTFR